jgi:NAD(P)-dependent dehydrogenase (short-subunit alcohol dehydrogenase family)
VEYTTDFSVDARQDVIEDARYKQLDYLRELIAMCTLPYYFRTTASDAMLLAPRRSYRGATVVITGANSGIGFETARVFARADAHVVVTVRDDAKGKETVSAIQSEYKGANIEYVKMSLESLSSVRQCGEAFMKRGLPVHLLILNAGVMACPYAVTEDKFELQMGVNHIAHQLFATLLLPAVKRAAPSRIIMLSSVAHVRSDIRWSDPLWTGAGSYDKWVAYGQSKTANILFAKHLNAMMIREGVQVSVNAVHPGGIVTNLRRHLDASDAATFAARVLRWKSIAEGAASTLVAATADAYAEPKAGGGHYIVDCNVARPLPYAEDMTSAALLWELTERWISQGPSAPLPPPPPGSAASAAASAAAVRAMSPAAAAAPVAAAAAVRSV